MSESDVFIRNFFCFSCFANCASISFNTRSSCSRLCRNFAIIPLMCSLISYISMTVNCASMPVFCLIIRPCIRICMSRCVSLNSNFTVSYNRSNPHFILTGCLNCNCDRIFTNYNFTDCYNEFEFKRTGSYIMLAAFTCKEIDYIAGFNGSLALNNIHFVLPVFLRAFLISSK